jgi:dipeptidyl aminopeptidase/acylaminoacyl peptidase
MQDDVADALLWAIGQGHVEKGRACIAGGSYGGYAALMGVV